MRIWPCKSGASIREFDRLQRILFHYIIQKSHFARTHAMAHKHKVKRGSESGNRPFTILAGLVQKLGIEQSARAQEPAKDPEARQAAQEAEAALESDEQIFDRAMEGVARINWRHDPAPTSLPAPDVAGASVSEEARFLQEMLNGSCVSPILDHPEYIEGWVGVAGRRYLPNLRSGAYSIQGSIDLHGLGRDEARQAVEAFILRMARERSCCVKIVHGRGINSSSDKAVLKEYLQHWLTTRRMSRHVVAYASAPHTDGGVGAIYVLLRRR
jgi:DNA-nicking Smr family endonuclease